MWARVTGTGAGGRWTDWWWSCVSADEEKVAGLRWSGGLLRMGILGWV